VTAISNVSRAVSVVFFISQVPLQNINLAQFLYYVLITAHLLLFIRARSQGLGCNAAIRLFVHPGRSECILVSTILSINFCKLQRNWSKSSFGWNQWRTKEFCSAGRGGSKNSAEDRGQRERGSEVGSPLVRGSGGSCNLVQEISFRIVKFS
jgi:hypothetical protein